MKKKKKKLNLFDFDVGKCRQRCTLSLPFLTCGRSKYAESLRFLRSRFYFGGRGNFPNDFKGLLHVNCNFKIKMV